MSQTTDRRRRKLLFLLAGWTVYALFFAVDLIIGRAYDGRPLRARETMIDWLLCGYIWAALTPLVLIVVRRFPFDAENRLRNLGVHVLAGAVIAFFQLSAYVTAIWLTGILPPSVSWMRAFRGLVITNYHVEFLTYWAIVGLAVAANYYQRYRERELSAARLQLSTSKLEAQLAQAKLEALRTQLQPHFLFNALNSISVLMRDDIEAADRTLVELSNLLRLTLATDTAHEIPLRKEIELIESYLLIQQTRFQDRLQVKIMIDPTALDVRVPSLILQPLVENAIKHGIANRAGSEEIEICAERCNGNLRLQVRDNGPGLTSNPEGSNQLGIGLSNTRDRLERLYGGEQRLELVNRTEGGVCATIIIPFRSESAVGHNPGSE
jgi:two-component system LytT family sensor kinase